MLSALFLVEKWWNRWIPRIRKFKVSPKILLDFDWTKDDPKDYTSFISILRFGTTSKTTLDNRHLQTNQFLSQFRRLENLNVLDVGASDGITSMNFMEILQHEFTKFYITDYNLSANHIEKEGLHYLFDTHTDECVLIFNESFIVKPNISAFFKKLYGSRISALLKQKKHFKKIMLLHPEVAKLLKEKSNIVAMEYNIFEKWKEENLDIIKIANLLNRVYFSDDQILQAIDNAKVVLNDGGVLAIIHNLGEEKASIYQKRSGHLELIHEINGGVEIKEIIKDKAPATS